MSEEGKTKKSRVIVEEIPLSPEEVELTTESTKVTTSQDSTENSPQETLNDKTGTENNENPVSLEEKPELEKTQSVEKDETKKESRNDSNSKLFLWILIPGIVLLGLLLGGIFAYYNGLKTLKNNAPQETPASSIDQSKETPSPTPTPQAKTIDLGKYPITILNGSGIKGEAGRVEELLKKSGFTVKSTGNAATYDYKKTVIQAKESVEKEFVNKLRSELEKSYVLDENQSLKNTEASSLIIIVGSSKSE